MVNHLSQKHWEYKRALQELWSRSSYERGLISDPFGNPERAMQGLERMRNLLDALGYPHLQVPSVHIAGSKGKGSTSAFVASMASCAGHRVGLYTSPHLHRFPERIAVNGDPVSDESFAIAAENVASAASRVEQLFPALGRVTTFEFVTAMAFETFARLECGLNVIEVGLGGRYDATNVLDPVATVITRIDLEHTAVLGSTYSEIAYQKAGILRPSVACLSSPQIPEAEATIITAAADIGAPLLIGGRDWTWSGGWRSFDAAGPWGAWPKISLGVSGSHQVENACTALAVTHELNINGVTVPEPAAREGLERVRWPGRFEIVNRRGRTIVFDGAHTPAAAAAVSDTWQSDFGFPSATIIFGTGSDKNAHAILSELRPIAARLILTRAASPRAADPEGLATIAGELGIPVATKQSVADAIESALTSAADPLLVTGSLFVAGEGREALGLAEPDEAWADLNASHLGSSVR